jgi:hypothetical protein
MQAIIYIKVIENFYLQRYARGRATIIKNNSSNKNRKALPRLGIELILEYPS